MTELPIKLVTATDTAKDEITAEIVEKLETWLERARKGEFEGLALVGLRRDDSFTTSFTRTRNWPEMAGAIATLQWRLIHRHTEDET